MMNGVIEQLLNIIAPTLGAVLAAFVGYLLTYIKVKKEQLKNQTDSDVAKKYIDMISNTVTQCVIAVNQTYVDSLKDADSFTEEAQKEAFEQCYNQVIDLLSEDCKKYIEETFSDIQTYLTTLIEAKVKEVKNK